MYWNFDSNPPFNKISHMLKNDNIDLVITIQF